MQERQLKMMLDHDTSKRAKKARPLVVGEKCHVLGPGNKWIDVFITGITDSGRSYETQVEATGNNSQGTALTSDQEALTFHICMLLSYSLTRSLQQPVMEMYRLREKNSVISGHQQLANGQKTVLSANCKESIKQTNTSQVLVSETVPDRRVQPSR